MPMRGVQEKAGIFAFAWTPILEQDVEDPDLQDQVANWIDAPSSPEAQAVVAQDILPTEVKAAIKP
ncbi:hypothetical protein PI124_g19396 [Phytophthora idaei]|nr:hypothetical protein PI125_g23335 [Phytophthora idaei]KAG3128490.1 hypothetical protein PI126_g21377 [Phytophthora idaei]KAG3235577.1 hypothetical protein PI124_g19396 [Phytophthora idaei]